jgi:hypothetical protein
MIDSVISKNEKYVYDKFKCIPKQTICKTYNKEEWADFLKTKKGRHVEGLFLPRTLTANILIESYFLEMNIFHEYFGHGIFCEYTEMGKVLVEKDKGLEELEKRILDKEVLDKDEIIRINIDNPLAKKYFDKRKKLDNFLKNNLSLYEGFAIQMEYFLAEKNNNLELFYKKYPTPSQP